jgi:hypothetical protein
MSNSFFSNLVNGQGASRGLTSFGTTHFGATTMH